MPTKTSNLYKYGSATQGLIFWGCWAFYVNSDDSFWAGFKAGLVQGLFSFLATLVIISALTQLYNYFDRPLNRNILPSIIILLCYTAIIVGSHLIAKTPNILLTVMPSIAIVAIFCSITTYKLASSKDASS